MLMLCSLVFVVRSRMFEISRPDGELTDFVRKKRKSAAFKLTSLAVDEDSSTIHVKVLGIKIKALVVLM